MPLLRFDCFEKHIRRLEEDICHKLGYRGRPWGVQEETPKISVMDQFTEGEPFAGDKL